MKGAESAQIPSSAVQKVEGVAVIEDAPKQVSENRVVGEGVAQDGRRPADRILYEKWKRDTRYR